MSSTVNQVVGFRFNVILIFQKLMARVQLKLFSNSHFIPRRLRETKTCVQCASPLSVASKPCYNRIEKLISCLKNSMNAGVLSVIVKKRVGLGDRAATMQIDNDSCPSKRFSGVSIMPNIAWKLFAVHQ